MKRFMYLSLTLATLATLPCAAAFAKSCPPGLAKKSVACVPPGLAKKGVRDWHPGEQVRAEDGHLITLPSRYDLPKLGSGLRYMILDNQIVTVNEETYKIVTVIRAVEAILD